MYDEFSSSLRSYLNDDGGSIEDIRPQTVSQYIQLGIGELMHLEVHDFAAIFSGCIGIANAGLVRTLTTLEEGELMELLRPKLKNGELLLLVAEEGHPAQAMVDAMVAKPAAHDFYLRAAILLAMARTERTDAIHMFKPNREN